MKEHPFPAILLLSLLCCFSCSKTQFAPHEGEYSKVLVICSLGFNNLSNDLRADINDLLANPLPGKYRDFAVVAYCHNSYRDASDYGKKVDPVLVQLHSENGIAKIDTLVRYPGAVSASKEGIGQALADVQRLFPSKRYGMLFSSHASGWIPAGYPSNGEESIFGKVKSAAQVSEIKPTWAGTQFGSKKTQNIDMEVRDLVDAIPFHLSYLIFDACLMSGIEALWEFKDKCDYIIASPTEILAEGFTYNTLILNLFLDRRPDLVAVCEDYYEFYRNQTNNSQSATVSLISCDALEQLAQVYSEILDKHRDSIFEVDRNSVQRYYYNTHSYYFYHDLRDFAAALGASPDELRRLDEALALAVPYHAETEYFLGHKMERCCGISTYIPNPALPVLNEYYRDLSWNKRVTLLE